MEKVQIIMFSLQETVISFFYVRSSYQYLKSRFSQRGETRRAMCLLLLVQAVIIAVDIALIVIDITGYSQLKLFIHSFVYSVKLELEFVVLNQLVELSRTKIPGIPSFSFAALSTHEDGSYNVQVAKGKGPVAAINSQLIALPHRTGCGVWHEYDTNSLCGLSRVALMWGMRMMRLLLTEVHICVEQMHI